MAEIKPFPVKENKQFQNKHTEPILKAEQKKLLYKDGEVVMSQDFITKREFDEFSKRLEDKIDNNFQLIDKSISNLSNSIDLKLENAMLKQAENERKEARESKRWIIGVLVFGIISAGTGILSLFI
ncbi:TPA_asm: hypothetical protein GYW94_08405 [Listeria monocytogenes]|nr:hypothetical protein [Listeria monocytogenes]HAC2586307.1 hypothetical protein [Listeria monocytogenes]